MTKRRVFIGINIPEDISKNISSIQTGPENIKWVKPENFHITITFLGQIEDDIFNSIKKPLSEISFNQFKINLKSIGYWQSGVLWIGASNWLELPNLKDQIDKKLLEIGIKIEPKPYVPHVTIARPKGRPMDKSLRSFIESNKNFSTTSFTAKEFVLFESIQDDQGSKYISHQHYPLK